MAENIPTKWRYCLPLILILGLAAFFRFYRLDSTPPGLYPDIAINGNDAIQSLQSGDFKLFYSENNGREGLMMWLIAGSFSLFGVSVLSIKLVAAAAGILTVLGVYLFCRELFAKRNEFAALLAGFFLAVLFWHVDFSRIGFRVILMPLAMVFSFYFFVRGFRTKRTYNHLLAGIFFAAGFYTYTGFRLAVILLFVALAGWLIYYWKANLKLKYAKMAAVLLLTIFAVAAPIGWYFVNHPGDFFGRTAQTSVFSDANPLLALGKSLGLHLAMFNVYGDGNWRHNYAGAPELFWPVGLLFLIGLAYSVRQLYRSAKQKEFAMEFNSHLLLLAWFFVMLLPGVLTIEGIPHALRTFGVIPPTVIFAGLGGWLAYNYLARFVKSRAALAGIGLLFLLAVAGQSYYKYFTLWANDKNVSDAFTTIFYSEGKLLSDLSGNADTVVVVNEPGVPVPFPGGIPMPAQTIIFVERADCFAREGFGDDRCDVPYSRFVLPEKINEIKIGRKTVILPMKFDPAVFYQLARLFPDGEIRQANNITYYETQ